MAVTPRLGLDKPDGIDFVDPVAAISNQMSIIDGSLLTYICTSTTRPAPSFTGMEIYETDTNKMYFWNGSSWQFISDGTTTPPVSGTGVKGRKAFSIGNWVTTGDVEPGEEELTPLQVQLNLEKGRRYRFYVGFNVRNVDSNQTLAATARLRGGEGASVTTSSPLRYSGNADFWGNSTGFNISHHFTATVDLPGSGTSQHTFGLFLARPSGASAGGIDLSTGDTTYQYIAIEDIGGL